MKKESWRGRSAAWRALGLLVVCCGLLACGGPSPETDVGVAARFFDSHPTVSFTLDEVGSKKVAGELVILSSDSGVACTTHQIDIEKFGKAEDATVTMVATGPDPQLIFDVDVRAGAVHEIVVDGKNFGPTFEVFWAGPGESFSPDRMIGAGRKEKGGPVRFAVGGHDLWRRRITKLRLDPTAVEGHRFQIRTIRLVEISPDPERLREASRKPWLVTLGAETRPASPLVSGESLRWEVEWKEGDRLAFGIGLIGGSATPWRFTVVDTSLPDSGGPVFSKILNPKDGEDGHWHEATVRLSAPRGPSVLEISAEALAPEFAQSGVPVVGSPMIVGERPRHDQPNIILISLDTLRPDHLGVYGYERATSPNIDRWAAKYGVVFETVVASAPWTLPSHISLLSGLDAVRHGINYGVPKHPVPLVPKYLSDWGYTTVGITAGGYLSSQYGFATGFDSYRAWPGIAGSEGEMTDGIDRLLRWLEDYRAENFFAFLHTYEIHSPYRPRAPYFAQWSDPARRDFDGVVEARVAGYDKDAGYVGLNSIGVRESDGRLRGLEEDEVQLAIDCYDAGIAYTDEHLGRLFDFLESSGLIENTVVIVTSDHGEALGEKGLFDHGRLYDPEILVPLIIAAPRTGGKAGREPRQVRLVDVAPTILDLAGGPVPDDLDGLSLVPILTGEDLSIPDEAWSYTPKTNHGVALRRGDGSKLIFNNTAWARAQGNQEWYDLAADPNEERPRPSAAESEDMRARIFGHLEKWERGIEVEIANGSSQVMTGEFSTDDRQDLIVTRIKGVDIPQDAVNVIDARTIGFRVPPGRRFTVVAEDLKAASLHLAGLAGDPVTASLATDIDLGTAVSGGVVVYEDGIWTERLEPPEGGTWIRVGWRNSGPGEAKVDAEENARVLDQLRALGYVD